MAFSRAFISSIFISLLCLSLVQARVGFESHHGRNLLQQMDCGAACTERCRLSSRPNLCKRACGTCCSRCNCVPPGTSGDYETCACYANMTTRGNKRKCP